MHFVSYREVEIVDQIIPVINQNEREILKIQAMLKTLLKNMPL